MDTRIRQTEIRRAAIRQSEIDRAGPSLRFPNVTLPADLNDRERPAPRPPAEAPVRGPRRAVRPGPGYAELHCKSNFSFLRGASHPDELVLRAAELGYTALAITDRNTLAGVVRMHMAAKEHDLPLLIGAEIHPVDALPVALYAMNRRGYARLARLITRGRRRAVKGACEIRFDDLVDLHEDLIGTVFPTPEAGSDGPLTVDAAIGSDVRRYRALFADRLYLGAEVGYGSDDATYLARIDDLARRTQVPMVAANDVHHHAPERRFLQDVLTCIRERCTLETAGKRLFANAERHLKPVDALARLFVEHPRALQRTTEIAQRCTFSLDELRYEYPEEFRPLDRTPSEYLSDLTWRGARDRFPDGVPPKVVKQIKHELALIAELSYEPYFLTVWDIVRFARSSGILCQGRGSAANSAVCYCLGVTAVDPDRIDVLFERFVNKERNEPPDIDVDFEHERREEVFQYIYDKYGRDRAGIVAEVITYRPRSAVRDVGKVLGLSLDRVDVLAKTHEWWDSAPASDQRLREVGLDPDERTIRCLRKLVQQIVRFPRHLSQHVGGFVITQGPLCELVPIENAAMPDRTFIEWNKDDIDALGILKVDCLALGMLTAIRKCFDMVNAGSTRAAADPPPDATPGTAGPPTRQESLRRRVNAKGHDDEHDDERKNERPEIVPGPGGLAEGDGDGQAGLSGDAAVPGDGAARSGVSVAANGGVGAVRDRRRLRAGQPAGVHPVPENGEGVGSRPADADGSRRGVGVPAGAGGGDGGGGGTGSHAGGVAAQSGAASGGETSHGTSDVSLAGGSPSRPDRLSLHSIPPEDPAVYEMISQADTVGVFQIESRAQMSMLPRLRPRTFYDLVIEVAIVRPGPIQGKMVHPYLRRRNGEEAVVYPTPAIEAVLRKTLGVPLFQEQAIRMAVVAAGFTPGEADQLRRAMASWGRSGRIETFRVKLVEGMLAHGLSAEFAERVFEQIRGFGGYGFPESHAASFALLVYVSAWLKRYHPAAFAASVINSQPMGFYAPAQLIRDAQQHGVEVRPVDVNASGYDCTLEPRQPVGGAGMEAGMGVGMGAGMGAGRRWRGEPHPLPPERWGCHGPALRLGMRLVKGLSPDKVAGIERARTARPFTSMAELWRRSGASRRVLARLAAADAFRSMGLDRHQALWQVLAIDENLPLFAGVGDDEPPASLPELSRERQVVQDYSTTGLSLTAHPLELVRRELYRSGVITAAALKTTRHGQAVRVGGLVLVRQRPSTASGIVFFTLEDETGVANLIVRPAVYERFRAVARTAVALIADGRIERQGEVIHIQVNRLVDLSEHLGTMRSMSRDFH